ncbi:MAG: hypothetical protein GWP19_08090 [Planctomycetia bacterium]|nr:hypothetical protein [Planctomycetia bacterium]
MDQQTRDNKLIAEFMEYEKEGAEYRCELQDGDDVRATPDDMLFDFSWDWLIPVVDKINRLVDKHNYGYGIGIRYNQIKKAYKAVVKFIKWYKEKC